MGASVGVGALVVGTSLLLVFALSVQTLDNRLDPSLEIIMMLETLYHRSKLMTQRCGKVLSLMSVSPQMEVDTSMERSM